MTPVMDRIIKITFNADTHASMQWNFRPQQSEIYVVPGETALAFYRAKNPTDKPVIGISTYNVVPFEAGQYFNKIQDGIEPMWEDERNKQGGRWLITLNKQQRRQDLDRFWLETLLCLVGEAFDDYSDEVCGAVVNIRTKGDKIAIWTADFDNREAITHIGRVYKERLGIPMKMTIGYQSHSDTATKSGSTTKNKFVV
ncbi:Eukaryotic translation initiation factor 4E-1A [Salmo salar]|uniref:Eukaryotic translation initiation factor 4E-1A n=1 Tax=Salmo salar TaxID=8030 RepID=B5X3V5_SALSA|nr:Eukaryotic translation initiation factor 4E-1A [Salmo salar]ACI33986.1 Eukaryotic translation initiation factor 4E-1A [Salmo salar]|eukprot:NP_001133833.1 Eukaryotic translation initiation factor 4E-1A [Salmo salar]